MGTKKQKPFKKYAKLSNNRIVDCYYKDGTLRNFEKEKDGWYLTYDEIAHSMFVTLRCKVIKFGDSVEELLK